MKKKNFLTLLAAVVVFPAFAGIVSAAQLQPAIPAPGTKLSVKYAPGQKESWKDKLILYIPNRLVDLADVLDVSVGFGPAVKAKVWVTRYMALGGGIGGTAKLIKGYNRQYGAGLQSGWNASFMMLSAEDTEMYDTTRGVQKYFLYHTGVPSIDDNVYNFWHGPRDIFSVGFEAAAFLELDAAIHPFEIVDFFAGLVFLDPKHDDFTMRDIES